MWFLFALLNIVVFFTAPILVIPFAVLQRIPWWMNTTDDPHIDTQGLYEPQVLWVYKNFGQRVKTWYWLGIRNQMFGLMWKISPWVARQEMIFRVSDYPQTKNPYRPGYASVKALSGGVLYREYNIVWGWPYTSKCGQIRVGWKLQEMDVPGPVMFCFQIKPFLTRESKT